MTFAAAYLIACLALSISCFYMIFAKCYPDGIVGKLALLPVWLASSAIVITAVLRWELPQVAAQVVWMLCGLCIFILRHLSRFFHHHRRSRRPHAHG